MLDAVIRCTKLSSAIFLLMVLIVGGGWPSCSKTREKLQSEFFGLQTVCGVDLVRLSMKDSPSPGKSFEEHCIRTKVQPASLACKQEFESKAPKFIDLMESVGWKGAECKLLHEVQDSIQQGDERYSCIYCEWPTP